MLIISRLTKRSKLIRLINIQEIRFFVEIVSLKVAQTPKVLKVAEHTRDRPKCSDREGTKESRCMRRVRIRGPAEVKDKMHVRNLSKRKGEKNAAGSKQTILLQMMLPQWHRNFYDI